MTQEAAARMLNPSIRVGNTPMRSITLLIDGTWRNINLKLEGYNPAGSSKDRTAQALLGDLITRGLLRPSSIIVESTSGNLGVALAHQCQQLGQRFLAVIDPKATPEIRKGMRKFGAQLEVVHEQDKDGGYLLSRLNRVRELCARSSDYVWTNQYSSDANPVAHYHSTAPEIFSQAKGKVDAVLVAVSTGGTLVGIDRYFRETSPSTEIIAVDAVGSVIFGGPVGRRQLTGIGSSRASTFIEPGRNFTHRMIADRDAFGICRLLDRKIGMRVGGSSGAVILACAQILAQNRGMRNLVCVCADGGKNYESTIYSDEWLNSNGFNPFHHVPIVEDIAVGGSYC
jgi:2,3-diaminopropionate biosynthesis protein SbnA